MASLSFLLLSSALILVSQALPVARGGGHGLLPYEDQMMSHPASQGGGVVNNLYYQSADWRGRGLDQALQRLVERDQRREQEEELRAAYLAALLRLLSEAEPGQVEVVEEEDQGPPGDFQDFQGPAPSDYDETGLNVGRPPAAWWGLLEPHLAQALLDRMEPQLAQILLERARQERVQQAGRGDEDTLRRLVARLLSSIGPSDGQVTSGRRARRDLSGEPVSSTQRRTRRSLDDGPPPEPSNDPPLLRVKRLEEELHPPAAGLQRMKRTNTMATVTMEELNHGSRRRQRRAALNYNPQILIDQILEFMRE